MIGVLAPVQREEGHNVARPLEVLLQLALDVPRYDSDRLPVFLDVLLQTFALVVNRLVSEDHLGKLLFLEILP